MLKSSPYFSTGHIVSFPRDIRVTLKKGRFEFLEEEGQPPRLVLDTGSDEAGAYSEIAVGYLGAAADVPGPEMLRILKDRPDDVSFALSACKVLGYRAGMRVMEDADVPEAKELTRIVIDGGGFEILRAALEPHSRSAEVATVGFHVLKAFGEARVPGFARTAAALLPSFAAALAAHEGGLPKRVALDALDFILKEQKNMPAVAAARVPALVLDSLRANLDDENVTRSALTALWRLTDVRAAHADAIFERAGAAAALRDAMRTFPECEHIQILGKFSLGNLEKLGKL